jgi:hypothetical protein
MTMSWDAEKKATSAATAATASLLSAGSTKASPAIAQARQICVNSSHDRRWPSTRLKNGIGMPSIAGAQTNFHA